MANILPREYICHILPREYMNLVGGDGASSWSLFENSDLTFQKREGVGSTLPEYWNSNLWLAFILA